MSDMAATDYERFAHAALPHYGLDSATVTLLSYSENGPFLVESETGRQVLRVHRPGYHSLAAIESELDWMESLRRDSAITTPQVIPAPDGRRVATADKKPYDPDRAAAAAIWDAYSPRWQTWNVVRTAASGLALLLAGWAVWRLGRAGRSPERG